MVGSDSCIRSINQVEVVRRFFRVARAFAQPTRKIRYSILVVDCDVSGANFVACDRKNEN
jgi:hypothetical protein